MQLVFLYGPAASGKLTTARALSSQIGIPVFHNHLIVDALLGVFEFGSPEFVALREEFWMRVFATAARASRSLVFTFTPEATVPAGFPGRVVDVVHAAGGTVRFVRLAVSHEQQELRVENPDRREFRKVSDLATLRRLRDEGADFVADPIPEDLVIDTDSSTAEDSARRIIEHFDLRRTETPTGYGSATSEPE